MNFWEFLDRNIEDMYLFVLGIVGLMIAFIPVLLAARCH